MDPATRMLSDYVRRWQWPGTRTSMGPIEWRIEHHNSRQAYSCELPLNTEVVLLHSGIAAQEFR